MGWQEEETEATVGEEEDDGEGDEDEDGEEDLEGMVVKPRRKRRKYSSSSDDYFEREDSQRKLAQEVRKYVSHLILFSVDQLPSWHSHWLSIIQNGVHDSSYYVRSQRLYAYPMDVP